MRTVFVKFFCFTSLDYTKSTPFCQDAFAFLLVLFPKTGAENLYGMCGTKNAAGSSRPLLCFPRTAGRGAAASARFTIAAFLQKTGALREKRSGKNKTGNLLSKIAGFWLPRQESNLRWGSQSPLPYRLATGQNGYLLRIQRFGGNVNSLPHAKLRNHAPTPLRAGFFYVTALRGAQANAILPRRGPH